MSGDWQIRGCKNEERKDRGKLDRRYSYSVNRRRAKGRQQHVRTTPDNNDNNKITRQPERYQEQEQQQHPIGLGPSLLDHSEEYKYYDERIILNCYSIKPETQSHVSYYVNKGHFLVSNLYFENQFELYDAPLQLILGIYVLSFFCCSQLDLFYKTHVHYRFT